MRYIVIVGFLVVLTASVAYATALSPVVKALGGGTATVPHCQVLDYDIAASDVISSVNANVECDVSGTYNVKATVTSGSSGTGTTSSVSLTANTPLVVAVSISPSVTIGSSTYNVDIEVTK